MQDISDVLKTTVQSEECSVLMALLMLLEKNEKKEKDKEE